MPGSKRVVDRVHRSVQGHHAAAGCPSHSRLAGLRCKGATDKLTLVYLPRPQSRAKFDEERRARVLNPKNPGVDYAALQYVKRSPACAVPPC